MMRETWPRSSSSLSAFSRTSMKRLSGLWTLEKALTKVSAKLSKTEVLCSETLMLRLGWERMVAFQSVDSRKMVRRAARRRVRCSAKRFRKRWREWARRLVKSGPNRSPRTYSILCLSGRGGTAH